MKDENDIIKLDSSELSFGLIFGTNFDVIKNIPSQIDQEILFIDIESWKVFENYKINNKKILNQLGYFNDDFNYVSMISESFVERRSDFQGYQMKTMTEEVPPFIVIDHSFLTPHYFDEKSQTYIS